MIDMRKRIFLIVAGCLCSFAWPARATAAGPADVVTRLRDALAPHPRLLLSDAEGRTLKTRAAADARGAALLRRVLANADAVLKLPPLERKLKGKRLLFVSRDARDRIATLAVAYRCTGERRYFAAAREHLLTVSGFADYNPAHFLDVAEMTAGLAIGYDWLHAGLSAADRQTIRRAIVEKGLEPSFTDPPQKWVTRTNNWNQVCHGGLVMGALAVAEDAPDLARRVIERAVENVPIAMQQYAPDGTYPEGPTYWAYATTYNALMIATLQSALGSDFGLLGQPGFLKTADYRLHVIGPTGLAFGYSDGTETQGADVAAAAFYLASQRNDPSLLYNEIRSLDRLLAKPVETKAGAADWLMLAWAAAPGEPKPPSAMHYVADGPTPVGLHRSSWDRDATFVGIKGGSPSTSHAHMDVGTFVLDAGGERWAGDLGLQAYTKLEAAKINLFDMKQASQRWGVFRFGPMSHNILTVNGQEQSVSGNATITHRSPTSTVVDASPVYAGQLAAASRGVLLRADRSVRLQDDIQAQPDAPATVRWAMLTKAEITVDGRTATLTQNGKTLRLTAASPADVAFQIVSVDPPPREYDAPNPGSRLVTFTVTLPANGSSTLAIDFALIESKTTATGPIAKITPLHAWRSE